MTTTADITQLLARAAVFDQRFTKPNAMVLDAWREAITPHELELHELLDALTGYYSEPRDRVIGVGDVIRGARDARQRAAQRRAVDEARALPPGHPPQLEHGGLNADGTPIEDAYDHNGAGHLPCRTCHAQPGHWCENPDTGNPAKIPHLARLQDARKGRTL